MRKEAKIGLAGIAALVILFFGINYLKGINMLRPESYYIVDFTNINGLAKSSPVYTNGYKIGLVRDITYNHNKPGHVAVEIEVDQDIRIPKGSSAELITEMLGTVKMNMLLNYGNPEYNEPGDTIYGKTNEGILGVAEKELLPNVANMLPKLDSIMTALNAVISDPALIKTLHNIEGITASLRSSSEELNSFMHKDLPLMADNITTITRNFKEISNSLQGIDYQSTFNKIDSTLYNVRTLTEKLNSKDSSLGLLFNDDKMYNNLNQTAANAASLLEDLRENPKRYVHFSLFGKKDKTKEGAKR